RDRGRGRVRRGVHRGAPPGARPGDGLPVGERGWGPDGGRGRTSGPAGQPGGPLVVAGPPCRSRTPWSRSRRRPEPAVGPRASGRVRAGATATRTAPPTPTGRAMATDRDGYILALDLGTSGVKLA